MKIEIVKSEHGVELRRHNEDNSITIWLCETPEAALFQAASLLYGRDPDPKRSILVGVFVKKDDPRIALAEQAEALKKMLADTGIVLKPMDVNPLKQPLTVPYIQPSQPYVYPDGNGVYINPYVTTTGGSQITIIPTTWTTTTTGSVGSSSSSYTINNGGAAGATFGYAMASSDAVGYVAMNIASLKP